MFFSGILFHGPFCIAGSSRVDSHLPGTSLCVHSFASPTTISAIFASVGEE